VMEIFPLQVNFFKELLMNHSITLSENKKPALSGRQNYLVRGGDGWMVDGG